MNMAAKKQKRKKKVTWKGQLLGVAALITAAVFLPTTILLLMGMIPTIVAAAIDRTGKGTKALTVGAMNLAACSPFVIKLWTEGHSAQMAVKLISDPLAMCIMFAGAGIGYLIDWAMSGIVGTLLLQRSSVRLKDIKERQQALIARWGEEVTGDVALDPYGFPLEDGFDTTPPDRLKEPKKPERQRR